MRNKIEVVTSVYYCILLVRGGGILEIMLYIHMFIPITQFEVWELVFTNGNNL